ncbi:glycosyltransferase family 1 protein [Selenomonas sp. AB3002]|uniref:glycosyltransferase family 4 protein n=1 Tax=Selenomonas sp. AB3002 TaxID=1392502 RepID=UPI00296FBD8D
MIDCRYEAASGIGRCIREIVPRLLDYKEHRFTLIMPDAPGEEFMQRCRGKAGIVHSSAGMYSLQAQLELPRLIPECDIFWAMHYDAPLLPVKARKKMVTIHDVCHLALKHEFALHKRLYAKAMLKAVGRCYDQIITDSEFSRREIERYVAPQASIGVVYIGVTSLRDIGGDAALPYPYLLCVGNVKPHKNISRLLEAYALFRSRTEKAPRLLIVGKKDGFLTGVDNLEARLTELGVKDDCIFTGYVDDKTLAGLYKSAVGYVCPSLYEGFGLPPLEAMSYGTPVIAARAASLPEVLGEGALYIDPYDTEDMAAAMAKLTEDASLRQSLSEKGLIQCSRYDWGRTAKEIMERMVGLIC